MTAQELTSAIAAGVALGLVLVVVPLAGFVIVRALVNLVADAIDLRRNSK